MGLAFFRGSKGRLDAKRSSLWSACSVDQLVTGYPYCAIVENSTNTRSTQIHFGPDGSINSGELLAHSSSAGVAQVLLDQSAATSAANRYFGSSGTQRPAIVSGSAYLGWLQFDASNDAYASAVNFGSVTGATIFMRCKLRATSSLQILFEHSTNYNSNDAFVAYYDNSISRLVVGSHRNTGAQFAISEFNVTMTTDAVFCFRFDRTQTSGANQCVLFLNGVKQTRTGATGETGTVPSGNFGDHQIFVGGRAGSSLFAGLNLKTLAIYDSALSDSECTAISALL
jgi:hypothetical protein